MEKQEKRERIVIINFGRILGMLTSSSSIKAWLVWDYDRNASYLTWLFQKDIPLKLSQICEQ